MPKAKSGKGQTPRRPTDEELAAWWAERDRHAEENPDPDLVRVPEEEWSPATPPANAPPPGPARNDPLSALRLAFVALLHSASHIAEHYVEGNDERLQMLADDAKQKYEQVSRALDSLATESPPRFSVEFQRELSIDTCRLWNAAAELAAGGSGEAEALASEIARIVATAPARLEAIQHTFRHPRQEQAGTPANECVYLGRGAFTIGNETICMEAEDGAAMEILIQSGAAIGSQLQDKGIANPSKTFKAIRERYPKLSRFIILPGKKNSGGFRTTITRSESIR